MPTVVIVGVVGLKVRTPVLGVAVLFTVTGPLDSTGLPAPSSAVRFQV